ncbi:hypothetical protein [Niveibacterium sp. SC-1]|uniref:hypothetical protein n=1 Tax=Niveibacterium sp. SC-1 TaxID=3135646 RepID=UPI00311FA560
MPEGPSIVLLKEAAADFAGRKILRAEGNAKIDLALLRNRQIVVLRSWGKHFLIELPTRTIRIHFLLFGSYRIDERRDMAPRLSLGFAQGRELNFYSCSVRLIDAPLDEVYDWRTDVMSDAWDPALAHERLAKMPQSLACDALLDQDVFAGVGNIIKNEVLFRIRVHSLARIGDLPVKVLDDLVREARQYSFDFLEWKRRFVLREHWLAHRKRICPRCDIPLVRAKLGQRERWAYCCERCQVQYASK